MWQHSDDFSGQWLIFKNHKHLRLFILYKDHFRCQMLKNEWQDVWGSAVTLNLLLCFSSLCLDEETSWAHHTYCITESIHRCYPVFNIFMNEINGVFISAGAQIPQQGLWKRSPAFSLDAPVFNFVLHAMKNLLWCVLSGSLVCQEQWLQPLSNLF